MKPISKEAIIAYVEDNIPDFHLNRIEKLKKLKLNKVLKRKNPYLFKVKNVNTAGDFVKTILGAHLSSQEETLFGGFLEGLAIYICNYVYNGIKSSAEGIDLEFEKDNAKYIVSIKSGPNWGNSSQIKKMKDNFRKTKRILGTNVATSTNVIAVNGCCYGKDNVPDKGEYLKLCGQYFWEFVSGNANLYTEIVEPLGHKAKEKNDQFYIEYAKVINKFSMEFMGMFCDSSGEILWEKVVKFNSGIK
ncbi:PmeII family type II restriction endonuclease [Desulfobacula sp.]|uniref:PmeII family type II restriction endonuclease n=1 Tax=Desulfobacula sp. TaxID=2593537 RepID=UPI0026107BD2|nr:PmeII family type II restriction endonuclease [Desulfobacula sp.]